MWRPRDACLPYVPTMYIWVLDCSAPLIDTNLLKILPSFPQFPFLQGKDEELVSVYLYNACK